MNNFKYCNGAGCDRKFQCSRWLGNYDQEKKDVPTIKATDCKKSDLLFYREEASDYFLEIVL